MRSPGRGQGRGGGLRAGAGPQGGSGRRQEVRTFPGFTSGLEDLADWLADQGVTQVVMEATGQYWKPCWWVLEERGLQLMLVNARHVKVLPGRKTDVGDAAWLAELLECGLLRGSFVPPAAIRELRDLCRYRKRLIQTHTAETQRIDKTLQDAGSKLDSVASDLLGASGRAMLAALVAGERDSKVLAELARGRLRHKLPALREALRGRFRDHHALLLRVTLEHLEHLEGAIAQLDGEVDRVIAPFAAARDRLDTSIGVGKRAAECVIAEIGVDMGVFPTAGHLAWWAGLCPGNNVNGGKRHSGRPTKGNRWLREILVECAWAASHTRDTYLAAQFWRLARRLGKSAPRSRSATRSWSSPGICSPTSATTRIWAATTPPSAMATANASASSANSRRLASASPSTPSPHKAPTPEGILLSAMEPPPKRLCWRIQVASAAWVSRASREVQLPVVAAPVSQASTRTKLMASAVSTCCRWVLARPR
jgi:transposase